MNIQELPVELLEHIFFFLELGDLTEARLVNHSWNHVVINFTPFTESVVFLLDDDNDAAAISCFNQSQVLWKHLRRSICRNPNGKGDADEEEWSSRSLKILNAKLMTTPDPLRTSIESLDIEASGDIKWSELQRLVTQFPELQILKLSLGKGNLTDTDEINHEVTEFTIILRHLTALTLKLEDPFYANTLTVLERLQSCYQLRELSLLFNLEPTGSGFVQKVLDLACTLIVNSQSTLRTLKLEAGSRPYLNGICPRILSKLFTVNSPKLQLTTFSFKALEKKLGSPTLRTDWDKLIDLNSIPILFDFLKSQDKLTNLQLPALRETTRDHALECLPCKGLQAIDLRCTTWLTPSLFEIFSKLSAFRITQNSACSDTKHPWSVAQVLQDCVGDGLYKRVEAVTIHDFIDTFTCVETLRSSFPKLTHLSLSLGQDANAPLCTEGNCRKDSTILQIICQNLKHLKTLRLNNFLGMDDSAVTGIRGTYSETIIVPVDQASRELPEVPDSEIFGVPLSSLKRLTELSLVSVVSTHPPWFTDVGIAYGFKFEDLRVLELNFPAHVTLSGIELLVKYNPGLESVKISERCSYYSDKSLCCKAEIEVTLQKHLKRHPHKIVVEEI